MQQHGRRRAVREQKKTVLTCTVPPIPRIRREVEHAGMTTSKLPYRRRADADGGAHQMRRRQHQPAIPCRGSRRWRA